jgi:hypothetical protein
MAVINTCNRWKFSEKISAGTSCKSCAADDPLAKLLQTLIGLDRYSIGDSRLLTSVRYRSGTTSEFGSCLRARKADKKAEHGATATQCGLRRRQGRRTSPDLVTGATAHLSRSMEQYTGSGTTPARQLLELQFCSERPAACVQVTKMCVHRPARACPEVVRILSAHCVGQHS